MKGTKCCAAICAALRNKYVLERPEEYRRAFHATYGIPRGGMMWRAMQEVAAQPLKCPRQATK